MPSSKPQFKLIRNAKQAVTGVVPYSNLEETGGDDSQPYVLPGGSSTAKLVDNNATTEYTQITQQPTASHRPSIVNCEQVYPDLDMERATFDLPHRLSAGPPTLCNVDMLNTKCASIWLVCFGFIYYLLFLVLYGEQRGKHQAVVFILDCFLTGTVLYGIWKNVSRYVHIYVYWCCLKATLETWNIARRRMEEEPPLTARAVISMVVLLASNLCTIYVLLKHYTYLKVTYSTQSRPIFFERFCPKVLLK